jgi:hypothetical protein
MFRQIAPKGIVNKTIVTPKDAISQSSANEKESAVEYKEGVDPSLPGDNSQIVEEKKEDTPTPLLETPSQTTEEKEEDTPSQPLNTDPLVTEQKTHNLAPQSSTNDTQSPDPVNDDSTQQVFNEDYKLPAEENKDMATASGAGTEELVSAEQEQKLEPCAAVVEPKDSEEVARVHEEMSRIGISECPFLMNRE